MDAVVEAITVRAAEKAQQEIIEIVITMKNVLETVIEIENTVKQEAELV